MAPSPGPGCTPASADPILHQPAAAGDQQSGPDPPDPNARICRESDGGLRVEPGVTARVIDVAYRRGTSMRTRAETTPHGAAPRTAVMVREWRMNRVAVAAFTVVM